MINQYYFERYENQAHSDIYKYFEDGHELYKIALENPAAYFKIFSGLYENDENTFEYVNRLHNWKAQTSQYKKAMNYQDANFFSSHRSMARVNSLLCFATRGYLPSQTLLFCFMSFVGIILIYLTFLSQVKLPPWLMVGILCCSPSLLIWTSSIQKESLMVFGIGMFVYGLFRTKKNAVLITFGAIILLFVSYFNLVLLILAFCASLVYSKGLKSLIVVATTAVALLMLIISLSSINPLNPIASRFNLQNKIGKGGYYMESISNGNIVYFTHDNFERLKPNLSSKIQNDLIHFDLPSDILVFDFAEGIQSKTQRLLSNDEGWYYQKLHFVPAKSYVPADMLKPEIQSFTNHFIGAIRNTLTIPIYEWNKNAFPFYLECMLMYLMAAAVVFIKIKQRQKTVTAKSLFLLTFAMLSLLLIGYSTPVLGNIIRHKSLAILFLIVLLLRNSFYQKALKK